ncbi:MAG: hypothetical protein LBM59_00460 [Ruminococcus sp.]|jgi:hypothetical protein|nr:hypothetical protein [Ruminococcus sp.]
MSTREIFIKDVPIMPDRVFDKIWNIWQKEKSVKERTGSELAEIIGEEEFIRIMKEAEDEKNICGPYKSAAELIRDALED